MELTVEKIKQRAGEFDIESVYTLSFVGLSLRSVAAVAACSSLTELDVSDNHLTALDALGGLEQLKVLVASTNRVQRLEPLRTLASLRTLRLDANAISNLDEVHHLAALPNLAIVYFRKVYEEIAGPNPICGHPAYRPTVLRLVPNLTNLDGERIRPDAGAHAATLYGTEPDDFEALPPLEAPTIAPVFSRAELDGFRAALAGASAPDSAAMREAEAALYDSKRLVARALSLVGNYAER